MLSSSSSVAVAAPRRDLRSLLVETAPKRVALPIAAAPAPAEPTAPRAAPTRFAEVEAVAAPDVVERMVRSDAFGRELICAVCIELLHGAVQCRNGHVFCGVCGRRCAVESASCPMCRCEMPVDALQRALWADEALKRARVRCRFAFGSDLVADAVHGCDRLLPLAELAAHEASCSAAWLQCAFAPLCATPLRPAAYERHVELCDARPVVCRLCDSRVCARDLASHQRDVCPRAPSGCSLCAWSGTRAEFFDKHAAECANVFVPCDVCAASVRRGELQAHNDSALALHVDALAARCGELARANDELKQRVETLGALPTRHRFTIAAHIDTFGEAHRTTPPLVVDGLAFAVRLELTREQQCAVSLLAPHNLSGSVTANVAVTFTSSNGARHFASRRQALQFTGAGAGSTRAAIGFVAVARDWLVQQCGLQFSIIVDVWILSVEQMIAM